MADEPTSNLEAKPVEQKKRAYASNSTLYVVFTLIGVVALNLIGTRVFGRLDLTSNGVYTLSPASKDVVKALPDFLTVKAYISKDMPPELVNVSRYVRDLLDEYRTYSNGKLRFEAYDPVPDKKEEEAATCKVNKLQVQVMRSQKFEVGTYYLGLCLQYAGQSESIGEITRPEGLEYQISSLIKRMTQKKRKVAFTTGHGESDLGQGFQFLKQDIEREFSYVTVNPSTSPIADDVDALVVGGPKQAFDDKGRKEIDSFLMKGKGVVFLVDGMTLSSPNSQGMPEMEGGQPKIGQANDPGLKEILEKYGFKVNQDFLLDRKQMAPALVDLGGGRRLPASLPVFLAARTEEVSDKDFSVLANVNAVVFPFSSSVELVGPLASGKPPAGGRLWTLAKTSPNAWKESGFFFFTPQQPFKEGTTKGSFPLGFAYQGPLKSAYAPAAPAAGMSSPDQPATESKKPVRMVVIGDSDFATDEYVQLSRFLPIYSSGAVMLINAVSWTIEEEALTRVRTKTIAARPIEFTSEASATALEVVNVAGVPMLFIVFGVLRWRMRKARRADQKI